jgi:hypothetical protein
MRAELVPARTASGFPLTLSVDTEGGVLRLVGDKRCLVTEGNPPGTAAGAYTATASGYGKTHQATSTG